MQEKFGKIYVLNIHCALGWNIEEFISKMKNFVSFHRTLDFCMRIYRKFLPTVYIYIYI